MGWASHLCSLGEKASDDLRYWEGHEALGGETFAAQLRRQLWEDFEHMRDVLVSEEGVDAAEAELVTNAKQQERLVLLIENAMHLYASASGGGAGCASDGLFWSVKLEINASSACVKFHDDFVSLRLVTALVGDGTVLAPDDAVDWKVYKQGLPEEVQGEGEIGIDQFKAWNLGVVTQDFPTSAGDAVLMKGGQSTASRPCLHRAPYSADCGSGCSQRLLITVERISADDKAAFVAMFDEPMTEPANDSKRRRV